MSLEAEIDVLPAKQSLGLLPMCHTTMARLFDSILQTGELIPHHCTVFGDRLLYMYYGLPWYMPAGGPQSNVLEAPVALIFEPRILDNVECFYPFDTGAVAAGLYGTQWKDRFPTWKNEMRVRKTQSAPAPTTLVSAFYETNPSYLAGEVRRTGALQSPLASEVSQFLCTDPTSLGVDQRHRVIECHFKRPISLASDLYMIGIPIPFMSRVASLRQRLGNKLIKPVGYYWRPGQEPRQAVGALTDIVFRTIEELKLL